MEGYTHDLLELRKPAHGAVTPALEDLFIVPESTENGSSYPVFEILVYRFVVQNES